MIHETSCRKQKLEKGQEKDPHPSIQTSYPGRPSRNARRAKNAQNARCVEGWPTRPSKVRGKVIHADALSRVTGRLPMRRCSVRSRWVVRVLANRIPQASKSDL